jgi:hypothetical protein
MRNPLSYQWFRQFLVLTLLGFAIAAAIMPGMLTNPGALRENWKIVLITLIYTYVLAYGSTYISNRLDPVLSWLNQPARKFLLLFSAYGVYSFSISAIIFYIYAYFMFNGSEWLTWSEVFAQARFPAIISLSISIVFTAVSFLTNWRKEAIRAERLEKEKIATQYESLKNQVNPHFLFNSLNALSELVYADQELAVKYIRQLSQVYRYVLDSRDNEVASLRDELEFLDAFIFLQKIRFGDSLQVAINVKRSEVRYILPLALQILLENAIKHNIVSREDPLQIDIFEEDGYLVINNKLNRKKSAEPGTGIGLENISLRYRYLSQQPVEVQDDGDQFTVKIPILTEQK